jgi:hypothetical protein
MKRKVLLLIFIIIFILSSLVAILAKDLSKEEIVNELKKIVIIANKDIRLEKYDILAEKLGLKIAEDPIIKEYSGSGAQTMRPFTVKTAWEIQWDAKDDGTGIILFQVYLYDADGNPVGIAANQTKPGKGSFYNPKKGTFYLTINTTSDWEIKIVTVE